MMNYTEAIALIEATPESVIRRDSWKRPSQRVWHAYKCFWMPQRRSLLTECADGVIRNWLDVVTDEDKAATDWESP